MCSRLELVLLCVDPQRKACPSPRGGHWQAENSVPTRKNSIVLSPVRKDVSQWKRNENERAMSAALEKATKEVCAKQITTVAIACVVQKAPYVFPIVGGRKVEHLQGNLEALEIVLIPEIIKYLEGDLPFDLGFPMTMTVSPFYTTLRLILSYHFWYIGRWQRPGLLRFRDGFGCLL